MGHGSIAYGVRSWKFCCQTDSWWIFALWITQFHLPPSHLNARGPARDMVYVSYEYLDGFLRERFARLRDTKSHWGYRRRNSKLLLRIQYTFYESFFSWPATLIRHLLHWRLPILWNRILLKSKRLAFDDPTKSDKGSALENLWEKDLEAWSVR